MIVFSLKKCSEKNNIFSNSIKEKNKQFLTELVQLLKHVLDHEDEQDLVDILLRFFFAMVRY